MVEYLGREGVGRPMKDRRCAVKSTGRRLDYEIRHKMPFGIFASHAAAEAGKSRSKGMDQRTAIWIYISWHNVRYVQ